MTTHLFRIMGRHAPPSPQGEREMNMTDPSKTKDGDNPEQTHLIPERTDP